MNWSTLHKEKGFWAVIYGGLAVITLLAAVWFFFTPKETAPEKPAEAETDRQPATAAELSTCPVCGYRTLPSDSSDCPVCYVALNEQERITWEYASMEEMIREEQAMFFAAEGFRDSVSFLAPLIWETEKSAYQKDTVWRTVVTEPAVLSMGDTMLKAGGIIQ